MENPAEPLPRKFAKPTADCAMTVHCATFPLNHPELKTSFLHPGGTKGAKLLANHCAKDVLVAVNAATSSGCSSSKSLLLSPFWAQPAVSAFPYESNDRGKSLLPTCNAFKMPNIRHQSAAHVSVNSNRTLTPSSVVSTFQNNLNNSKERERSQYYIYIYKYINNDGVSYACKDSKCVGP